MLSRLVIHNYALIKELDIQFNKSYTIITGETGAGKSILLGALNLILGSRADASSLLDKSKKCIVEAEFDLKNYALNDFFETNELDYSNHTFIRREINAEGKSRAFINDTPVNLNTLRGLTLQLVDIHSQRDSLALIDVAYQMTVVDAFAKNEKQLIAYKSQLVSYKKAIADLNVLIEKERTSKSNFDYLQFQLNELEGLNLKSGEQTASEQELDSLNNAEEIKSNLLQSYTALNDESGLINQLREVLQFLKSISKYNNIYKQFADRIESCKIELADISNEIENAEQEIIFDAGRIEILNDRLNLIYRLQNKHQLKTVEELINLQKEIEEQVRNITSLDIQIENQHKIVASEKQKLTVIATEISKQRLKTIPLIESKTHSLLKELGMPQGYLKIELIAVENEFYANGTDQIQFQFSANKGHDFKPIIKVASGGELSRVMLCIKALTAEVLLMPTMIFDEIDTGVSGEIALKVGKMMLSIAKSHQVISITHLPQIAAGGISHLYVYKSTTDKLTTTNIRLLTPDERIVEIAKMIGGNQYTESAVTNARELINSL